MLFLSYESTSSFLGRITCRYSHISGQSFRRYMSVFVDVYAEWKPPFHSNPRRLATVDSATDHVVNTFLYLLWGYQLIFLVYRTQLAYDNVLLNTPRVPPLRKIEHYLMR